MKENAHTKLCKDFIEWQGHKVEEHYGHWGTLSIFTKDQMIAHNLFVLIEWFNKNGYIQLDY